MNVSKKTGRSRCGVSKKTLSVAAERERHERETETTPVRYWRREPERPFLLSERPFVTLLIGGLSQRHLQLLQAVGRSLDYRVQILSTPTKEDYQIGREFGDNGMCNPVYFNAGALVRYLQRLRDVEGLSTKQIIHGYVVVLPGSCGPCRFGMYEAEYRLILRNAGFSGFRVIVFEQRNFDQGREEMGLELSARTFLPVFCALFIGDLLNELAYQIRPYEVEPGRTDAVFTDVTQALAEHIAAKPADPSPPGIAARLLARMHPTVKAQHAQLVLEQLLSDYYEPALRAAAARIQNDIEVDYTRPKPIGKITGEFWAQTTEGAGNFSLFSFLEAHGAEVLVEPVATWFFYLTHQAWRRLHDERGLRASSDGFADSLKDVCRYHMSRLKLRLGYRLVRREYERLRLALGGTAHAPVDQAELIRLASPYYNPKCVGGEGHLEIGKTLYYSKHALAHLVLSVKPFGCLPSTQSDGAQAAVQAAHPEITYLPLETSGEGDANAYSRVLMALGEAKEKCRSEFEECLARTGRSLDEIRSYAAMHPELRRPLQHIPRHMGVTGKAANFVLHVAGIMNE